MMRKVKIANLVAKNSVYDKSADKFIKKMNYIMEQKITIRKKAIGRRVVIDLTGPDGNAFVLIRTANKFARQLSLDAEKITAEMKSGDYENLVMTFDKYFGEYVILER